MVYHRAYLLFLSLSRDSKNWILFFFFKFVSIGFLSRKMKNEFFVFVLITQTTTTTTNFLTIGVGFVLINNSQHCYRNQVDMFLTFYLFFYLLCRPSIPSFLQIFGVFAFLLKTSRLVVKKLKWPIITAIYM
jgi:hypothetical protein